MNQVRIEESNLVERFALFGFHDREKSLSRMVTQVTTVCLLVIQTTRELF